jgi:hypothetical protein
MMCYRAIEAGGFGNMPRSVRHLGRGEKRPDCELATPHTLRGPRPETDWNVDWHRTVLRTMARRDFSRPRVVCNSSKTKWKGGGVRREAAADF